EGAYYKKRYGRQTRALSNTTDSTGGYLSPQLFSDMLYENISRTSLVRKYATMIPMNGYEVINFPTVTTGISASQVSEATGSVAAGVSPLVPYDPLEFDDLISMESALAAQYLIGDDIQGSGLIDGAPQYFLPHAMVQTFKKKKNGIGDYLPETRELRNDKQI